ncbi:MAG: hypothetical protein A2293_16620 [Elusimicrobia bacterium RIFOXYB2_FULL_49_7]|nr:MAG: hypothetical protein A2293_16620 [Elusimicrobia bacterium RIFOXYB2_FULL_49_7]
MLIKQAQSFFSEWLSDKHLPDFLERDLPPIALSRLNEVLALIGPRRSGKTYYLFQLIRQLEQQGILREEILYADFDDMRLSETLPGDFPALIAAFSQVSGKPPRYLFLENIQRFPDWPKLLRNLYDHGIYRIIVTGCRLDMLSGAKLPELQGRYSARLLLPLSFREALRFKGIYYTSKTVYSTGKGRLLHAFDDYLREGGFPEVVRRSTLREKRNIIQNYYRHFFFRDMLELHSIKSKNILEKIMSYCMQAHSELFSISAFTEQLKHHIPGASKKTVSAYLNYLRDLFFLILNEKYSPTSNKRVMNPKKAFLIDTGFSSLFLPAGENGRRLLQNSVAVELMRREAESYYFKQTHACDFLIRQSGQTQAIQVLWEVNPTIKGVEFKGLLEAIRTFRLKEGLILTYDQEDELRWKGTVIRVQPVWKWLLGWSDASFLKNLVT